MHLKVRTRLAGGAAAVLVAACSGGGSTSPTPTPSAARPSSPASLSIVSPTDNQTVTRATVHVQVSLTNAHVVAQTSTHIHPDEGHVHLYLNEALIYMQYSLEQDVPVKPGTYTLKAEFVAADHAPFSPRVWSQPVLFVVH